jgi:hypothetical protein
MERENNEKERNTEQENDKSRIGGGQSFFKEGERERELEGRASGRIQWTRLGGYESRFRPTFGRGV